MTDVAAELEPSPPSAEAAEAEATPQEVPELVGDDAGEQQPPAEPVLTDHMPGSLRQRIIDALTDADEPMNVARLLQELPDVSRNRLRAGFEERSLPAKSRGSPPEHTRLPRRGRPRALRSPPRRRQRPRQNRSRIPNRRVSKPIAPASARRARGTALPLQSARPKLTGSYATG
jgi:hypothetical protein